MEVGETTVPSLTYPYSYSVESSGPTIDQLRAKIAPLRFRLAARSICRELNLGPEDLILEIGSGLGLLGKEIKNITGATFNFIGIDICAFSVYKSRKLITSVGADAIRLPFPDNSFDKVVSTDVLEHIQNATKAVGEIFRVLKPGGITFIVIADPSEARFAKVKNHIARTDQKADVDWWEKLFKESDFDILETSKKYRDKDWRKIFKLPFLVRFKDKPLLACALNPVCRPGVYILQKPLT